MSWSAGISAYNWIDQPNVTITADTEALTGPVGNVTSYEAGVPWIALNLSLSSGIANMTAIFSQSRSVGCLGFLISERQDDAADVDFTPYVGSTDLVKWQLSSDPEPGVDDGDVWSSADLDEADGNGFVECGLDPRLGVHGIRVPRDGETERTARRVDFSFKLASIPSPPLDVAHFGRMWAGPWREFETTHDWGAETGWDKDELGHDVRVWSAPFNWIPEAAQNPDHIVLSYLDQIAQQVSDDRQIFFWPRTDKPAQAFFARFAQRSRFRSRFLTNMSTGVQGKVSSWAPSLKEDWLGI